MIVAYAWFGEGLMVAVQAHAGKVARCSGPWYERIMGMNGRWRRCRIWRECDGSVRSRVLLPNMPMVFRYMIAA